MSSSIKTLAPLCFVIFSDIFFFFGEPFLSSSMREVASVSLPPLEEISVEAVEALSWSEQTSSLELIVLAVGLTDRPAIVFCSLSRFCFS